MRKATAFMVLGTVLLLAGCARSNGDGGADSLDEAGSPPQAEGVLEGDAAGAGGSDGAAVLPAVGPQVVKTAEVRVTVHRGTFQDALRRATAAAGRYGGFVASTTTEGQTGRERRGTLVLRVPSEHFEQALSDLHGLGKVDGETVSGEDVTQEFVDLEARLRNLRGQEAVLLRLYDRAKSIADTIRIQTEVSRVQTEIEQIEGRLRYLRDRTSLGTITATVVEPAPAAPGQKNVLRRAWDQAVATAVAVASGLIVALGTVAPVLVLLGVPALLVWRRLRPRPSPPA
jgi:hypothetical protein